MPTNQITSKPTGGTRPAVAFPFNTTMKLSTLVRLAGEVERELGKSPRCTVNERRARLAEIAGHCRTKAAARSAIADDLGE
jgi:hypothetical protein